MRHLCSQEEGETVAANLVNKLTGGTRHLQLLSYVLPVIDAPVSQRVWLFRNRHAGTRDQEFTNRAVSQSNAFSLCLCTPHLSTCVHVCEGPRPMSGAVLQLRLGLLLQWDSSSRLVCVSREPQGSFHLRLPRAGITGAYHQACFPLYAGDGIQALTPMWQAPD